jgi:hypothetical protein
MSEVLAKHVKLKRDMDAEQKADEEDPNDARIREKIIAEAKKNGATLGKPDAKGGLPPSLVLGVFRRDKWKCKKCGSQEAIGPHHKGGIVESKWLSKKGHSNDPNNISTLCEECHDAVHEKARDEGTDSSQVTPSGDKGNPRRDRGLPKPEVDK